jgi:ribonuclease-3
MHDRIAELFFLPEDAPHLDEALTHPSYANETKSAEHYQRLEFLGDAVLGLVASELLWERFPRADEGQLTRMRARLVNAESLARWARAHGIADALRLGRGADASGLRESTSVLSDAVEALIAAAYLDGGLTAARRACVRIVEPMVESLREGSRRDAKSELQERVQKRGGPPPVYEVVDSGGPPHEPWFVVRVRIGDQIAGEGRGGSKRAAERGAAEVALESMENVALDETSDVGGKA